MSRAAFIIGLLISGALHGWLLSGPAADPSALPTPEVVSVVETDLARRDDPQATSTPSADKPDQPSPEAPPPAAEPPVELVKVAEPPASRITKPGDLAGDPGGRPAPELRIDWGTEDDAVEALRAGGMKIVILDGAEASPLITQQVERAGEGWNRGPYRPGLTTPYSNRLRIVEKVPAFEAARRAAALAGRERLAVLVPTRVERLLESAQLAAAFERGVDPAQIRSFGGRFSLEGDDLAFRITHVGEAPDRRELR